MVPTVMCWVSRARSMGENNKQTKIEAVHEINVWIGLTLSPCPLNLILSNRLLRVKAIVSTWFPIAGTALMSISLVLIFSAWKQHRRTTALVEEKDEEAVVVIGWNVGDSSLPVIVPARSGSSSALNQPLFLPDTSK